MSHRGPYEVLGGGHVIPRPPGPSLSDLQTQNLLYEHTVGGALPREVRVNQTHQPLGLLVTLQAA